MKIKVLISNQEMDYRSNKYRYIAREISYTNLYDDFRWRLAEMDSFADNADTQQEIIEYFEIQEREFSYLIQIAVEEQDISQEMVIKINEFFKQRLDDLINNFTNMDDNVEHEDKN